MQPTMKTGISQPQPKSRPTTSALFIAWSAMAGSNEPVNQNSMQAKKPKTAIIGSSSGGYTAKCARPNTTAHTSAPIHGPFQRVTLEQFFAGIDRVAEGPSFGDLPTLWIHGTDDPLVPLELTRPAIDHVRGSNFTERIYQDGRHESFNEINRDSVLEDVSAFLREALAQRAAA